MSTLHVSTRSVTTRMRLRAAVTILVLAAVLVLACLLALRVGAAATTAVIVGEIRAPRVVMAVLIGAALGVAGTAMQAVTRNPLADPAIVGVSAGAALGAAGAIALGLGFATIGATTAAVLVALLAIAVVLGVAMSDGRPSVVTLVLAGVAVTAFATAAVTVVVSTNNDAAIRSIAFWTSGSLALSTWPGVVSVLPWVAIGAVLIAVVARDLDLLTLGDRAAHASGVPVRRVRVIGLVGVALLVASGVAVAGVIAFIGLVIPHAMRAIIGPRHAALLPASALAGALLLLAADTVARTVAQPVEIPVGAITALVGAPAFFALLLRTRGRQGGWA